MERFDELYYVKPYVREFRAEVTGCRELEAKGADPQDGPRWAIELSQTAFYPEGGGQPGDRGSLKVLSGAEDRQNLSEAMPGAMFACGLGNMEAYVLDTQKEGDVVLHICDNPLPEGLIVEGVLDWQYRKDHMEAHSGEHIVSGLIHQRFGLENIGFHMGDPFVTIDFSGPMTWDQVKEIETLANQVIRSDIEFEERLYDGSELADVEFRSKKELEGIVRIVTVPGADVCACCGTHVVRTGEVGLIKIASLLNRKKGARLEMLAGRKAIEYWQRELDHVTGVCQLLSLQPHELLEGVTRLNAEKDAYRYKLHGAVMKLLEKEAESVIARRKAKAALESADDAEDRLLVHFVDDADMEELRFFCNKVMDSGLFDTCAALSVDSPDKTNYVIMSHTRDLKPMAKPLNAELNGRGGGSKNMIQGSYGAPSEVIEAALEEVFQQ